MWSFSLDAFNHILISCHWFYCLFLLHNIRWVLYYILYVLCRWKIHLHSPLSLKMCLAYCYSPGFLSFTVQNDKWNVWDNKAVFFWNEEKVDVHCYNFFSGKTDTNYYSAYDFICLKTSGENVWRVPLNLEFWETISEPRDRCIYFSCSKYNDLIQVLRLSPFLSCVGRWQ